MKRISFLLILLGTGIALAIVIYLAKIKTPYKTSLAPLFQITGKATKGLDRLMSKVIPVDSIDEKELGDLLAARYDAIHTKYKVEADWKYLKEIMKNLSVYKKKPFDYRIYLYSSNAPNAYALPGGIIVVSLGLLNTMKDESQVVAVIGHEMGHIEQGHCLDAVKYSLMMKKIGSKTLGDLADFAVILLLSHSFSKTMENEADEYSFELLKQSKYNPTGMGESFYNLMQYQQTRGMMKHDDSFNPVRDYFSSHPPIKIRHEKFSEKARVWWWLNKNEKRYNGRQNLQQRVSFFTNSNYQGEWMTNQ